MSQVIITNPETGRMVSAGRIVQGVFHPRPAGIHQSVRDRLLEHLKTRGVEKVKVADGDTGGDRELTFEEYAQVIR